MSAPRIDTALTRGTRAGADRRNGLPPVKIYRYQGNQPMAADPKFRLCQGRCGRRIQVLQRDEKPVCAVCRGAHGPQRGGQ